MEEKRYIITEEQVQEILNYLKTHSTLAIQRLLNQNLEEIKEEKKE